MHIYLECRGCQKTFKTLTCKNRSFCSKECYCKSRTANKKPKKKGFQTAEYKAWADMKQRCYNEKTKYYHLYGGRGIIVFREWVDSFEAFFSSVGKKPSRYYQLDRIDNNGNYEPGNVRWATPSENTRNRAMSVKVTLHRDVIPFTDALDRLGQSRKDYQKHYSSVSRLWKMDYQRYIEYLDWFLN